MPTVIPILARKQVDAISQEERIERRRLDGAMITSGHEMPQPTQPDDALTESRRYLQAIFENSLDAIFLLNDDGRYIDANPAACELLGYRPLLLLSCYSASSIREFSDSVITRLSISKRA